jgi:hypothetical protein
MPLTDLITIRLPAEKRFWCEKEAAHQGKSLSAYLRERLEKSEASSHNLSGSLPTLSSHDQGVLLEILLLLRSGSSPEKMRMVQNELKRLNIPVWTMDSVSGK